MKGMVFWEWGFNFWFLDLKETLNNLKFENGQRLFENLKSENKSLMDVYPILIGIY